MKKLAYTVKLLFLVILALTTWLFFYAVFRLYDPKAETYVGSFDVHELSEGWTLTTDDGVTFENVSLPLDGFERSGERVWFRNTLPADVREGMRLCARAQRQDITIRVNGVERGHYYAEDIGPGRRTAPSAYLLVDLYDEDALGTLELEIVPNESEILRYHAVTYAYGNNVWFPLLARNVVKVAMADILVVVGVLAAAAYFLSRKKLHFTKGILYLAETMFVAGMWILSESEIRQIIFRSPSLSNVFAFLLIEIMPPFLLMYFDEIQDHHYARGYVALGVAFLVNVLLASALNAARIVGYYDMLRYFHGICGLAIAWVVGTLVQDIRRKRIQSYSITAFGMLLLLGSFVAELLKFYFTSAAGIGALMGLGLILLLGATVMQAVRDELRLTEQKRMAEAANRAKSSFLANMSHEIRTPINAILGLDEMILRESGEGETVKYAADIQAAGRTLLSLINDVLDLSKVEEGKMEIVPAQYELRRTVNDLVNLIRRRAEKKGLRFELRLDENAPCRLVGDEVRIRQCVLNLLTNAVKYTERGTVTFEVGFERLSDEKAALRFRVSDTGIGIKPEDMDKLFAPFARFELERNRTVEGTGLGMAITRQLLELMGSRLEVESVYGVGSTFSFSVEQTVEDWTGVGPAEEAAEPDAGRRTGYHERFHAPEAHVLVVDDMPVNLTVICGLLKRTQLRVDTAESGPEALEKAAGQRYDIAFIDHMMPGMDGVDTLGELKKLPGTERTVCIALTANALVGSREKYLAAGFSDYLPKPVDSVRLEEMLMRWLPPEKVIIPEEVPPEENAGTEETGLLPAWLKQVEGLDTSAGMRFCGSQEDYLEALAIFAGNAPSIEDELEVLRLESDTDGLTVKVHALKSASRAIGAGALSDRAERLELAGKGGDARTLYGGLDELLSGLRALGEQLAPLRETAEREEETLPPISPEKLREAYEDLRVSADSFDSEGACFVLNYLAGCRLPPEDRACCDELLLAARRFDWDRFLELLNERTLHPGGAETETENA